jgi:hypothetical protein
MTSNHNGSDYESGVFQDERSRRAKKKKILIFGIGIPAAALVIGGAIALAILLPRKTSAQNSLSDYQAVIYEKGSTNPQSGDLILSKDYSVKIDFTLSNNSNSSRSSTVLVVLNYATLQPDGEYSGLTYKAFQADESGYSVSVKLNYTLTADSSQTKTLSIPFFPNVVTTRFSIVTSLEQTDVTFTLAKNVVIWNN